MRAACCLLLLLLSCPTGLADETQWLITETADASQVDNLAEPRQSWQNRPVRKVAGALAVVLGLFFLVSIFLRNPAHSNSPDALMQCLGQTQVTSGVRLHLVKVGSRILVLHISGKHVERVAEIDDPQEVQQILATSHSQNGSATQSVGELLQRKHTASNPAAVRL